MKEIVATEEEIDDLGNIILIRYWYLDGTYSEKKVFIPPNTNEKEEK